MDSKAMENLPLYLSLGFALLSVLSIYVFYKASKNSKITLYVLSAWWILQSMLGLSGFYTHTDAFPPRFLFLILPPLVFIIGLFSTSGGRQYMERLDGKTLTLLHSIRVPVEMFLFFLFIYRLVPKLMTFEGRNFDILSGLSAPLIYYFGMKKKLLNKKILLLWNFICLGLLINIVVNAVLSAPFPFQKFAFDQPNIAVLYFPFNLLPAIVVPLVLFSHLAVIMQLLNRKSRKTEI